MFLHVPAIYDSWSDRLFIEALSQWYDSLGIIYIQKSVCVKGSASSRGISLFRNAFLSRLVGVKWIETCEREIKRYAHVTSIMLTHVTWIVTLTWLFLLWFASHVLIVSIVTARVQGLQSSSQKKVYSLKKMSVYSCCNAHENREEGPV